jgi:transposase
MKTFLERNQGSKVSLGDGFRKYFELIYHNEGKDDERLVYWDEKTDVVNREISLCGYFVIITSEKMTAEEALVLYKSRDASEKLFRGDKSYLGQRSMRCHLDESIESKLFIEFVALIVRNRIYTRLKDEIKNAGKKDNYMTVPAAIRELEKIEMIRFSDNRYRLDRAVTATQKAILKAFGMTAVDIRVLSKNLSDELQQLIEAESADDVA